MRHIGELDDESKAHVFTAFLLVKGIESHVDPKPDGGAEIWIKDEDQFQESMKELKTFKSDASNPRYSDAIQHAKSLVLEEEKRRKRMQKNIVRVGTGNRKRRPPLTLTLIALCVLVALMTDFGDFERKGPDSPVYQALQFVSVGPPESVQLARLESQNPDDLNVRLASIKHGQIWRIITPMFIHYEIFHIIFNMYWLFLFGSMIENRYGGLKFGLLVLAASAAANLIQCTVPLAVGGSAPAFISSSGVLITIVGGMSGVVYGLFGFVWMKMLYDPKSGFRIPQSTIVILIGWMILCIVLDTLPNADPTSSTANWAHGAGLMMGVTIGYVTSTLIRK